ncbi:MAG: hypothetical protein US96_C0001G0028 [Candidatus Woesebacteria bacterium GW2011_GWB1_38_5b]|uniref:Glycosyltransferase 2-like domain-containing protein n=1 Tax=Candidatus Woesebacteria bacterium GW2011_GWB1_38_5b TaxID=1618569 RepID=A0A0G0KAS2_9BACT|nr:MAG: hypothetical protein US96_C0001G0028 [Candidatus Woesebacteria bacterium GW2011_GWB1_38_5b]
MKVSVVVTCFNEEATIVRLLDSLLKQTRKPQEIVIVDGGSTDQTVPIIKQFIQKHSLIRLVEEKGTIAHGRNVSIQNAKYPVIAQTDAGCTANRHWLARITQPLEDKQIGLVAGFYYMTGRKPLQKAIAPFFGVPRERFDPRCFLPSGRSVAFRKHVWQEVGGYSEKLERAGEDTLFNYQVLRKGIPLVRVQNALVYWEVPKSYWECVKKFYFYAKGDAQAGIWWHPAQKLSTHNIKISLIFARYFIAFILFLLSFAIPILGLLLVVGFIFYVAWASRKFRDVVNDPVAQMWVPILQITADLSVMAGFASGILRK